MDWFKFYGAEYLADPKMMALTPAGRSCWVALLSNACVSENGGQVKHLTEQRLMMQAGIDIYDDLWKETEGILNKFVELDMITLDNGVITIKNWQKRQGMSLTGYERVKKYR